MAFAWGQHGRHVVQLRGRDARVGAAEVGAQVAAALGLAAIRAVAVGLRELVACAEGLASTWVRDPLQSATRPKRDLSTKRYDAAASSCFANAQRQFNTRSFLFLLICLFI